jgi:hypothetical protein
MVRRGHPGLATLSDFQLFPGDREAVVRSLGEGGWPDAMDLATHTCQGRQHTVPVDEMCQERGVSVSMTVVWPITRRCVRA